MKKLWRKVRKGSPARSGNSSPKSGSLRGSVASLNLGYDVKEKDLGKLHKAAWIGDLNKVKQLARKDPSPLDKENRTPLHLACVQGNEHIVQELLEWKAKANIGDNQCRTPLMRAVEFQQEGCVHLLLSYHVDIETVDTQGNTPLHISIFGDNLNIINMLIKAGAALDRKNKDGFSALHLSVKNKYEDVCRLLLKEGANVNVEDPNLRTPLMYACQDGTIALVKLLLEYRADTIHKDSKGWSADDCAVIQGHHACSQLISDYLTKMNRGTPASTPRSSLPPSVVNTPRDKDSIGIPMIDGGGDDSDNEQNSRASGGHGSDSWADSPDVSVSDPRKAAKPSQKISMLQFTKNIHISESDTDGESVSRSSLKRKTSVASNGSESEGEPPAMKNGHHTTAASANAAAAAAAQATARQTSWQSSGDENSWNDSPTTTPRKNSTTRVSFKRDEELSEIHDITVTESEAESETGHQTQNRLQGGKPNSNSGDAYVPTMSTFGKNIGGSNAISVDKMKENNNNNSKKPAIMDDLGINDDVDDISEMTDEEEEDNSEAQPAGGGGGGGGGKSKNNDSDWDASAMSDIMTTPRPGILKKTSNAGLGGPQEEKHVEKLREEREKEEAKPKMLIKAPVIDSDDESSAWDTTEADNIHQAVVAPPAVPKTHPVLHQQKSSLSEYDSDVEDMIQPVVPQTPTPPVPTLTGTVPKEVEAIVRQKQVECQDFDEDDAMSPVLKADTPTGDANSPGVEPVAKFYMSSVSSDDSFNGKNNAKNNNKDDDDDEDDDWDSTVDAITPRQNAGLQYKEVNIGGPESISESVEATRPDFMVGAPPKTTMTSGVVGSGVDVQVGGNKQKDDDDDEEESTWDSDDDALPSEPVPANQLQFLAGVTTSTSNTDHGGNDDDDDDDEKEGGRTRKHEDLVEGMMKEVAGDDEEETDEETETVSSWEIERRTKRQAKKSNNSSFDATMLPRQRDMEEEAHKKEQQALEAQLAERQAMIERQRAEQEEEETRRQQEREREEEEKRIREERERREREERERREKEMEEEEEKERKRRQREKEEEEEEAEELEREREEQERRERKEREELERWEREDQLRRDEEERMRKELQEKEEQEWGDEYTPPDTVRVQQEELNRIDQQFQLERQRREEDEKRKQEEQVEDERDGPEKKEEEGYKRGGGVVEEEMVRRDNVSAAYTSPTKQTSPPTASSPGAGVYVNIGSSTVDQIRQRLQVPAPSTNSPLLTSTGQFSTGGDRFDDNDSLFSDNPGDERPSYLPGLGSSYSGRPIDDDALSYTSTEFEDPVQSSAAYARDRDVMSNINISDPSSLLKVQEYVRDCRRQLEKEKNQRVVFENKVKISSKEKMELSKKVEGLTHQKSELEQGKLDLEAKIRSLEYTMSDEEEKRKNAELLLNKTKDQLTRKESTYASELEAKQKAELTLRNVQIEMRSSANTIKELEEEKEELQRQLNHAHNARSLQEQINDDQHKLIQQQQQQQQQQHQQHTPRDLDNLESNEMAAEMDKLKAELYALKMEMERQRSRFKDELAITGAENEELMNKVDELRNDIKLNEEALAHATMQYNIQVTSLRTDLGNASAALEKERAGKDKLEAEVESLKTRLVGATHEMDKTARTRNEMER